MSFDNLGSQRNMPAAYQSELSTLNYLKEDNAGLRHSIDQHLQTIKVLREDKHGLEQQLKEYQQHSSCLGERVMRLEDLVREKSKEITKRDTLILGLKVGRIPSCICLSALQQHACRLMPEDPFNVSDLAARQCFICSIAWYKVCQHLLA